MQTHVPGRRMHQTYLALAASGVIATAAAFLDRPLVLAVAGLLPLALIGVLRTPLIMALGFTVFSFFRIHEVFPALYPLRIPQMLALAALASLGWNMWCRRIQIYWSSELAVFSCFFIIVSIGVIFATNRPEAWSSWSGTYVKIGVMTFALAWAIVTPAAFKLVTRTIISAGALVSFVALYNKINGIGLVENTRVTIGRDIGSMLGDPNDLALVLLFPASFALSTLLSKSRGKASRIFAAISFVAVFAAIIATQSRGGLLGVTAVIGVFAWRRIPNKGVIAVGAVAVLLILFLLAGVGDRASGGAHEEGIDESAMGRIYAWGAAWSMAITHPVLGVGLNNFLSNYWAYSSHWDGNNHAVHSTWFGVLAETGFVGLIFFVIMVAAIVRSAIRSVRQLEMFTGRESADILIVARAVEAGLVGFIVSGTFLTMGFTWPLYILLSLASAVSHYARTVKS